jgi:hypothetical protein
MLNVEVTRSGKAHSYIEARFSEQADENSTTIDTNCVDGLQTRNSTT